MPDIQLKSDEIAEVAKELIRSQLTTPLSLIVCKNGGLKRFPYASELNAVEVMFLGTREGRMGPQLQGFYCIYVYRIWLFLKETSGTNWDRAMSQGLSQIMSLFPYASFIGDDEIAEGLSIMKCVPSRSNADDPAGTSFMNTPNYRMISGWAELEIEALHDRV